MKAAKPITAAAAALAITAASVCPIYADADSVQDSLTASTTSDVYSGFAVANVEDESYCNVRSDADINSDIVGVFYPGSVAEVIGEKDGWTEITSGNVSGYVRSDLLATGSDVDTLLSSENYTSYAMVTAPVLNVRSGAGLYNDIIGQYSEDEKLHLLGYQDGWYKVDYDGETGYVSADWLKAGDDTHCALTPDEYQEYLSAIAEGAQDTDGDMIIDSYPSSDDTSAAAATTASADDSSAADSSTAAQSADTGSTAAAQASTDATAATSVSSSDLDLLASIIYCEAGNQTYEGQVAVGAVVMNRVKSVSYPNSISGVIYQSGQFTPASSGVLARALANGVPASCYSAAQDALNGSDPTGGLYHFHAGQGSGKVIDGQTFY